MPDYTTEIAIVGGGICGLWLLNLLRDRGYDAMLLERDQLGGRQTLASQGMIHGGIKYALGGFTTQASETIANMPETWRRCIHGDGQLNLHALPVLSNDYYLFSDGNLTNKVTAFFASKTLRGRISPVTRDHYPDAFQHPDFTGKLYKLQDMVIDTGALLERLHSRYQQHIYQATAELKIEPEPRLILNGEIEIQAKRIILAAGEGNGALVQHIPGNPISMQTRPLKQVLVKGDLPPVYAHAVSMKDAAKPKLTISTHAMADGSKVWYLGGNLAEQGVGKSDEELIRDAQRELKDTLPWIPLDNVEYRTLAINRAEPTQESGSRPDFPYVREWKKIITCWPTKLTLTPLLAEDVLAMLPEPEAVTHPLLQLPQAQLAPHPWETAFA